jgi:hypothetical protein
VGEAPGWYHAEDLDPGDQLRTPTGDHARITDIRAYTATTRVHNLTINGVHTYYVGEIISVFTHNAGACLAGARFVSGKFPREAGPNEVLARKGPSGNITNYQVYGEDGLPVKRVDVVGKPHGGVSTPHVVEFERHVNPVTGEQFFRAGKQVRPATPEEVPGG